MTRLYTVAFELTLEELTAFLSGSPGTPLTNIRITVMEGPESPTEPPEFSPPPPKAPRKPRRTKKQIELDKKQAELDKRADAVMYRLDGVSNRKWEETVAT